MYRKLEQAVLAALIPSLSTNAQSPTTAASGVCPSILTPTYPAPVVGAGYTAQLVATGLKRPRGIIFDNDGGLLVVQQGTGIIRLDFNDGGGTCLTLSNSTNVSSDTSLNHGIEISPDGKTLYASSAEAVFSWSYDSSTGTLGSDKRTLVNNMTNADHSSRTLMLSRKVPGLLLVSRGSAANLDDLAADETSGHSQIRAFNVTNFTSSSSTYDYPSTGFRLGWGLRNSVGVAEHPVTGGIFSVENSADQLQRLGVDIHQDDPGEELNYHGFLNDTSDRGSYGYPHCFALWETNVPDKGNMTVGSQFVLDPSPQLNDTTCATTTTPPRLTLMAHTAPLDMKFSADGALAYVTMHGSWNRDQPTGYKLTVFDWGATDGEPTAPPDSKTAAVDVLSNADTTVCPGKCFRPVGLAIDAKGRIFMSSDSTGEIYVVQKNDVAANGGGGSSGTGTATGSGTLVTSTSSSASSPNAAGSLHLKQSSNEWLFIGLTVALSIVGGVFVAMG